MASLATAAHCLLQGVKTGNLQCAGQEISQLVIKSTAYITL